MNSGSLCSQLKLGINARNNWSGAGEEGGGGLSGGLALSASDFRSGNDTSEAGSIEPDPISR